ncbi:MAG: LytTR family DNA-binding domain-containing protein [Hyphomonadaceae bacterium]
MTNGGANFRIGWPPFIVVCVVSLVVAVVNATSALLDMDDRQARLAAWEPWVWELSSVVVLLPLALGLSWAIWRWPPPLGSRRTMDWARFAGVHLAGSVAFSALHVGGMVLIRMLAYRTMAGWEYAFDSRHGGLALALVYEWRKDALSYAAICLPFWGWRYLRALREARSTEPAAPAGGDERIEIRDGGRTRLIAPADIVWLEAAGNYVEIHLASGAHLARGTLASFEAKLAPLGFVRVHRSRLVNRTRVAAFRPTPSGDLELTLDDGRTLAASRRYRAALERRGAETV